MKKSLVLVLIVLMASAALFADATVGGWGRIVPFLGSADGADPSFMTEPGWSKYGRLSLRTSGSSDNNGFVLWFDTSVGANTSNDGSDWKDNILGENVYIWAQPSEMLKLYGGKVQWDTFRGKFGGGSAAFWGSSAGGEDDIFMRLYPSNGLVIEVTPAAGFTAAAAINTVADMADSFEAGQYAVGYEIEGVGLARAQYVGSNGADEYIQAAFLYTGMEGLKVDAGVKMFIDGDNDDTAIAAVGASYATGAINVTTRVKADILADDTLVDVYALLGYSLTDAPISSVNLEVGYDMTADETDSVTAYGFARKSLAAGYMSIGFGYTVPMGDNAVDQWRLPLVMEYWF